VIFVVRTTCLEDNALFAISQELVLAEMGAPLLWSRERAFDSDGRGCSGAPRENGVVGFLNALIPLDALCMPHFLT